MSFFKTLFIMITSLITGLFADKSEIATRPENAPAAKQTLYDFKVKSLVGGKTVDLGKYKGKKVVILNVASKCGYTKQYADWEKFYKDHGDKVVVLGFPANNFGGQEPGTSEEIATFCSATYGVTFPMFEKVSVLGEDQDLQMAEQQRFERLERQSAYLEFLQVCDQRKRRTDAFLRLQSVADG
jgi:glutathione peroxidase